MNYLNIAYLSLYYGYPLEKAMEEAIQESKFQLVLNLLNENKSSINENKTDKNLFHLLANHSHKISNLEILKDLYQTIKL